MENGLENRKFKIAILGTRGVPSHYGGFETFVEELSTRLVKKGHSVIVYGRKGAVKWEAPFFKGARVIMLPTLKNKYLDTIFHTFISSWHVVFLDVNIVFYCNAINSAFLIIPKLFGKKTVINVDGLEWRRDKWSRLGKMAYKISERLATVFADAVVTDSCIIKEYYKKRYSKITTYIPYGANKVSTDNSEKIIGKYGLKSRQYILYVGRLEPENNAHIVIEAYEKTTIDKLLAIVGDAPYAKSYIDRLHSTKDERIKFLGSVYGEDYYALLNNAFLYVHGHAVGGTNPALLQAMMSGNCVIANGVDFNKEVLGEAGMYFKPANAEDLKDKIEYLCLHPDLIDNYRILAKERVEKYYTWEEVTLRYEKLFQDVLGMV